MIRSLHTLAIAFFAGAPLANVFGWWLLLPAYCVALFASALCIHNASLIPAIVGDWFLGDDAP